MKRGAYKTSIETRSKILTALLLKGKASADEIQINKDRTTIMRNLKSLEAEALVFSEEKRSQKLPHVLKKVYGLTTKGLIIAIGLNPNVDYDVVAKANAHILPLVFNKWDKLKRFGLRDHAINTLRSLETLLRERFALTILFPATEEEILDEISNILQSLFYPPFLGFTPRDAPVEKLKDLIRSDREIKEFVEANFKKMMAVAKDTWKKLEAQQQIFLS